MRIASATSMTPARISTSLSEVNTASTTPRPKPAQHCAQQLQSKNCFFFILLTFRPVSYTHLAAWTAYGKIDGFFWMILSAFDVSITTFVGQNFGAQKYSRIRKSVRVCLVMAFATAILSSVLL